jgi:MFS family permease
MMQPRKKKIAYRWVIVIGGIFGLFASLGIGRFALGMLLPAMVEPLQLTYSQMGFISTLNFCGYLAAVLLCGRLIGWVGSRTLISLALLLVGGSMCAVGWTENTRLIMLLYLLTGVGSGLSNVPIMALISRWFEPALRGRAIGMVVIGNGLGIILGGHLVPMLNGLGRGWQLSWQVFGAAVLVVAGICWLLLRNEPSREQDHLLMTARQRGENSRENPDGRFDRRLFWRAAAIYFLFGFTYVIYATFFVSSLVQQRGFSESGAGLVWSWIGLLSLGSGPLFGSLSDRLGRRAGLMLVFSIQTVAYGSAAAFLPFHFLYLSAFCFAIVAWSVPSIMAALVGDFTSPRQTAAVFGYITFIFGIGQIAGPYCAGLLAERSGGFGPAFLLASGLAFVAVLISAKLPKQKTG